MVAIHNRKILRDFEMTQLDREKTADTRAATAANRQLLTVPKTAAYLGLSEYSVRTMVRRGQLPTRQVASRTMIPVTLLREWLERRVSNDHPSAAEAMNVV